MKILLVHNFQLNEHGDRKYNAVSYYRMLKPNIVLHRLYNDIEFTEIPMFNDNVEDSFLQEFNLVLFCRHIDNPEHTANRLNKLGIKFGLDEDDYWFLPDNHILYPHYIQHQIPKLIIDSIKVAHFITCTTPYLADKVKEINPNVYVIENGIDTHDEVWKPNKSEAKRIRFAFTQGVTHIHDIGLISDKVAKALYDVKFYSKGQIVLTGFNAEPNQESIYIGYERMLTDSLKTLEKYEPLYCDQLKRLITPKEINKPYRRIEAMDVFDFPEVYNHIDISVIPLQDNEFNSCKSELKLIEAGFKDCAAMVSNVKPYTLVANKQNSFLLSDKNFFEWQRYILNNPSIVIDKAQQLKEDVKKYSLDLLSQKRYEIYKNFVI